MDAVIPEIVPGGKLAENIAHFARALRSAGLRLGPGSVVDALEALNSAPLLERTDMYWILHAVFVKRHEDSAVFDQAFRLFFRRRSLVEKMIALLTPNSPGAPRPDKAPDAGALRVAEAFKGDSWREREEPKELMEFSARLTVSEREILKSRDFAQMSAEEILRTQRLIAKLEMPDDRVRTRRFMSANAGRRIDPRRTMRASMRNGGAIIELKFREPALRHPPIVALVDISGSMAEYSRLLLHFLHALAERRGRVQSFVFGTRLTNITRLMRARDPDEALAMAGKAAPDWEGGTRISAALHSFNRDWSRRTLAGGPIVLLFSDGLERSIQNTESGSGLNELTFEMDRLKRSCRRLIWLNPLLRFDAFEAKASGIRAMLPHVHEFRAIHNLVAMEQLCSVLSANRSRDADPQRWLRKTG
jgi:uncharacterized protein